MTPPPDQDPQVLALLRVQDVHVPDAFHLVHLDIGHQVQCSKQAFDEGCRQLLLLGRIDLGQGLREFCGDMFSNPAFQPLDLTPDQVYDADASRPNRDPSDALICAAARHLGLPLLSRDADIRRSGLVEVIW